MHCAGKMRGPGWVGGWGDHYMNIVDNRRSTLYVWMTWFTKESTPRYLYWENCIELVRIGEKGGSWHKNYSIMINYRVSKTVDSLSKRESWQLCMIYVYSFLLSCMFSNARLAAAASGVIYIVTYIPYMLVSIKEEADDYVPGVFKYLAVSTNIKFPIGVASY